MAISQEQLQNSRIWAVSLTETEFKAMFRERHKKGFGSTFDVFPTQEGYLAVAGLEPLRSDIVKPSVVAKEDVVVEAPAVAKAEQAEKDFKEEYADTKRTYCIGKKYGCTKIAKNASGRRLHERSCEHALKVKSEVENGGS